MVDALLTKVDGQFRRLCPGGKGILRTFRCVMSDGETTIISTVLKHFFGQDMTIKKYCAIRWRELKLLKPVFAVDEAWYMQCMAHFNHAAIRGVLTCTKGKVDGVTQRALLLAELKLFQNLQAIPWEQRLVDPLLGYKAEANLQAFEFLLLTQQFNFASDQPRPSVINECILGPYQSYFGDNERREDEAFDDAAELDWTCMDWTSKASSKKDKVKAKASAKLRREAEHLAETVMPLSELDADLELLQCTNNECNEIYHVRQGEQLELSSDQFITVKLATRLGLGWRALTAFVYFLPQQVECPKCATKLKFKPTASKVIWKIPVAVRKDGVTTCISYILLKQRTLEDADGDRSFKYIVYWNYIKCQLAVTFKTEQTSIQNPWFAPCMKRRLACLYKAPLTMAASEREKRATHKRNNKCSQPIENNFNQRYGTNQKRSKKECIQHYVDMTVKYMKLRRRFLETSITLPKSRLNVRQVRKPKATKAAKTSITRTVRKPRTAKTAKASKTAKRKRKQLKPKQPKRKQLGGKAKKAGMTEEEEEEMQALRETDWDREPVKDRDLQRAVACFKSKMLIKSKKQLFTQLSLLAGTAVTEEWLKRRTRRPSLVSPTRQQVVDTVVKICGRSNEQDI